jgi:hypothetical protein
VLTVVVAEDSGFLGFKQRQYTDEAGARKVLDNNKFPLLGEVSILAM